MKSLFTRNRRWLWRASWGGSFLLHGALIGYAMNQVMQPRLAVPGSAPNQEVIAYRSDVSELDSDSHDASVDVAIQSKTDEDGIEAKDPKWQQIVESANQAADEKNNANASPVGSGFIAQQVNQSIAHSKSRSSDQNTQRLDELSEKLKKQGTEKGIGEVSNVLSTVLGTKERKSNADPQAGKPFEVDSAQLDDVRKLQDEEGKTHYIAVMIDANGVCIELEMNETDGKQLYRTMKLIKSNPLLERVYRSLVMGVLDKLLSEE